MFRSELGGWGSVRACFIASREGRRFTNPEVATLGIGHRHLGHDSALHTERRAFPGRATRLARRATFKNWKLIASDDGSFDRTRSILLAFQKSCELGKVEIIDGPQCGATANFLFHACVENLLSEYYAFCDQDDVWDADKLERAIAALEWINPGIPAALRVAHEADG